MSHTSVRIEDRATFNVTDREIERYVAYHSNDSIIAWALGVETERVANVRANYIGPMGTERRVLKKPVKGEEQAQTADPSLDWKQSTTALGNALVRTIEAAAMRAGIPFDHAKVMLANGVMP